jgi:tetratricopeptide (TPR) repeat protein
MAVGCSEPGVVRVIEGRNVAGRFIDDRAYALYAQASEAEARGEFAHALAAYEAAADLDGRSAEIWTRIGAVRCAYKMGAESEDAFERAESRDASYEPLWHERARCELAQRRLDSALRYANRALALDPDRDETVLLHASIVEKLGRTRDAKLELVALTVRRPTSIPGWLALEAFAARNRDADAARAAEGVRQVAPRAAAQIEERRKDGGAALVAELDQALSAGDLSKAKRSAIRARVSSSDVALRAAALGRTELAREQAELVLGADPSNTNARIALAVACDLRGDGDGVRRAMTWSTPGAREALAPPSPLGRLLLAEVVARRVSADAARVWLGPIAEQASADPDALVRSVEQRLRARLAETGR